MPTLYEKLFIEVNPIPVKTAMNLMGMDVGELRLPLCDMAPENLEKLKKVSQLWAQTQIKTTQSYPKGRLRSPLWNIKTDKTIGGFSMLKMILSGCNGKMGQAVTRLCAERTDISIAAGFDMNAAKFSNYPVYADPLEYAGEADVLIDFSSAAALAEFVIIALLVNCHAFHALLATLTINRCRFRARLRRFLSFARAICLSVLTF